MTRPSGRPGRDCPRCPRLVAFRENWREREPQWFNAPVDSFGPPNARVLIVGLAPGLRGANRTGRPFTGDYAGDLLYATLSEFGFARGRYQASPDDGLELVDCRITNGARRSQYPFGHGRTHSFGALTMFDSYHCSRYNTNTGVLTPQMFRDVFAQ